jgi:hypothetical protein
MNYSGICPACSHKNRSGMLFCQDCGQPLTASSDETAKESDLEQATDAFRRAAHSTDRFERASTLLLHIRNQAEPMMVELGDEQLTLGRVDNAKGSTVDIDLTQYGALKTGVSRVHAVFFRSEDDTLYVADLGSANGTFLNGHQLAANEPLPVNNGDEISLGKMRMHVYFGSPAYTDAN